MVPVATLIVPLGVIANPPGAPTRLSTTLADAGGETPLRLSLASTLAAEVVPGATPLSVSLPATLGAYEDIKAILTQTSHEIELPNGTSIKDKRAHQQIALSTGLDDNGLFALTFDSHERYLPFEYTGAISEWTLTFPNHDMQKAILESINDIVIHLRYTARVKPTAGAQV